MLTFRDILRTGFRICSMRRKPLFVSPLGHPQEVATSPPATFRYGDAHDLDSLTAPEYSYSDDARVFGHERLRAGDRLVLCESGGRVVFYAWVMFRQMDMSCRNYAPLPPDCAYTYKLFTVADCRGQRICPAYYAWIKRELRAMGYGRLLAWVEAGNASSIRAHTRAGFRRVGCIWHFRFFFRSYFIKANWAAVVPLDGQKACAS
jgi:hypothetical protein